MSLDHLVNQGHVSQFSSPEKLGYTGQKLLILGLPSYYCTTTRCFALKGLRTITSESDCMLNGSVLWAVIGQQRNHVIRTPDIEQNPQPSPSGPHQDAGDLPVRGRLARRRRRRRCRRRGGRFRFRRRRLRRRILGGVVGRIAPCWKKMEMGLHLSVQRVRYVSHQLEWWCVARAEKEQVGEAMEWIVVPQNSRVFHGLRY